MRPRRVWLLVSLAGLLAACGAPVRVEREDPRAVSRELTRNVLTRGEPSLPTEAVLHRRNLERRWARDPAGALAALHQTVVDGGGDRRDVFALAELSFAHADDTGDRAYYLAAAVYAWAFLFPDDGEPPPDRLDPRLRVAADLYNRGLTRGLAAANGETVELRAGTHPLPFGQLAVYLAPDALTWNGRELYDFVPVAELEVSGLDPRYRLAGVGAPLAARTRVNGELKGADAYIARNAKVPVTALLRLEDTQRQLGQPIVSGTLEVYGGYDTRSVTIEGQEVPLEVEPTAALAWALADSPVWSWELRGFLFGDLFSADQTQLALVEPHRRGRIPVVFVHGTASSPGRWAEMLNDLQADPRIRDHFEFWFFFYTTGNPIPYSAARLRETLTRAVDTMDPAGTDPGLRQMVVIGHSQGGLLTKLTVVDPGDRLFRIISSKPIDQLHMRDATRATLESAMMPKPLPFVRRVVFIATPHHGSYVAAMSLSRLVARFVRVPANFADVTKDLITGNSPFLSLKARGSMTGAVYGMAPGSRFIETLAAEPIVPGVVANSIIAVEGDGPIERGTDGVVAYQSAHIPGVESELVVRSSHSCQGRPETIEEVRRILLEHGARACAAQGDCGDAAAP